MRFGSRFIGLVAGATTMLALGGAQAPTVAQATNACTPLVDGGHTLPRSCSDTIIFAGHATVSPDVQQTGGSGTFTFTTSSCLGLSDSGPTDQIGQLPESNTCSFTASGTYTNTVCGTGSATITSLTNVTGLEGYTLSANPVITFTASAGTFTAGSFTDDEGNNEPIATNSAVQLGTNAGDLATPPNCVSGFEVTATINLEETPSV